MVDKKSTILLYIILYILFSKENINMVKIYNKLIRDRIPEIIEKSGAECKIEILPDERYLEMIDLKLDEELAEYHKDPSIEELADLLEVIRAATIARGYTLEELEAVRANKAENRGTFEKKILLLSVAENKLLRSKQCILNF